MRSNQALVSSTTNAMTGVLRLSTTYPSSLFAGGIMRMAVPLFLALLFVEPRLAVAQGNRGKVDASSLQRLPSTLLRHVKALGNRAVQQEKEETELVGIFTDDQGRVLQARVVSRLSGEVLLEGFKDKKTVRFDGLNSAGEIDRVDEALLETFAIDTVEGMFVSLKTGGALQILGMGFGPASSANSSGLRYDIYDVTIPTRTRRDLALRTRRYFFDSETGILVRTRYVDPTVGAGLQVETRFSQWRTVDGSLYPGLIERFEDGRLLFSFRPVTFRSRPADGK